MPPALLYPRCRRELLVRGRVKVVRVGVVAAGAGVDLELDFRPRLNAGYEAADADGGFAPPGTREAFAQASLRATYCRGASFQCGVNGESADIVAWLAAFGSREDDEEATARLNILRSPVWAKLPNSFARVEYNSTGRTALSLNYRCGASS